MNASRVWSTLKWNPTTSLGIFMLTVLLLWYLQYHWKRRRLYKLSRKVPGPTGLPIIGSSLEFVGSSIDTHNNIMKLYRKFPGLVKVWFGPQLVYGVSKPEYLEAVLTSPKALSKMYLYRHAVPVVGHGIFTASVPLWRRHRKIIMPAFNQKILDGFVEVFARQSTTMTHQLEKYVGQGEFDIFPLVNRCSLDIICETAMGISVDAQTTDSVFGKWVDRLMEIIFLRMFVMWYHFDFIFKWTQLCKEQYDLLEKFHAFTGKIVKERREAYDEKIIETEDNKRKAFLDLLIELSRGENKLTDEELRDEVNTFMIAGSDTTATSSSFIFLILGMHPQIQDKLYHETVDILGTEKQVEARDLPHLKYTERVIKETMRLFPIGPFIVRDIDDDLVLEDDLVLPKGSSAILGILAVHRDGEVWPNPLKFDPDRFLAEEVAKRHSFAYLPFSGGPRNCIGPKYAMMAMKTMVATVIRKYKFETSYKSVEDVKLKSNIILRPRDGFRVSVTART